MYARELQVNYNIPELSQSPLVNLLENEDFILSFSLVTLAKNHNFFSSLDKYMKEFSRICVK